MLPQPWLAKSVLHAYLWEHSSAWKVSPALFGQVARPAEPLRLPSPHTRQHCKEPAVHLWAKPGLARRPCDAKAGFCAVWCLVYEHRSLHKASSGSVVEVTTSSLHRTNSHAHAVQAFTGSSILDRLQQSQCNYPACQHQLCLCSVLQALHKARVHLSTG